MRKVEYAALFVNVTYIAARHDLDLFYSTRQVEIGLIKRYFDTLIYNLDQMSGVAWSNGIAISSDFFTGLNELKVLQSASNLTPEVVREMTDKSRSLNERLMSEVNKGMHGWRSRMNAWQTWFVMFYIVGAVLLIISECKGKDGD